MTQTATKSRLMNKEEFRTALEQAIEGNAVAKAPFTIMWANGELKKEHFARWVEQHYAYVGPFAEYLAYIFANCRIRMREIFYCKTCGKRSWAAIVIRIC